MGPLSQEITLAVLCAKLRQCRSDIHENLLIHRHQLTFLYQAVALAVIEIPRLAGGTRRRVLPGGEPSLGVVGEQRASGTAARAGGGAPTLCLS